MSNSNSFLFLPDISGFTEFVSNTEIDHSQHIISELLETIMDANELDLTLAEIEGDALFYYKHESVPDKAALLAQIEKMYLRFHEQLSLFEQKRICQCGACASAINLDLKFICHAGNINFIKVKDSVKPYGKEVIVAHRLMKNNVPMDEYALMSGPYNDLSNSEIDPTKLEIDYNGTTSQNEYKEIGEVQYEYFPLTALKDKVIAPDPIEHERKTKNPLVFEYDIKASPMDLFELVSNLDKRLLWNSEVDGMKWEKNKINQIGTEHTCVINNQQIEFVTVGGEFGKDKFVIGEKTKSIPLAKSLTSYYIIEGEDNQSKLNIELHIDSFPIIGPLVRPFIKKVFSKTISNQIEEMRKLVEKE